MSESRNVLKEFEDRDTLRDALLTEFQLVIGAAIEQRGTALIALSGGSTPLPLYQAVASLPFDWQKVCFALVDERWLPSSDPGSNEYQLRKALAPALKAGAKLIGMYSDHEEPSAGEAHCEARYQKLCLPFDLLLLGMGGDGHFASLFPKSSQLGDALNIQNTKLCTAIQAPSSDNVRETGNRMSLTLAGVLQTRRLLLLISGQEKREIYLNSGSRADDGLLPIDHVLQQQLVPVEIYWAE